MELRNYQEWLVKQQWDGYPLARMLPQAVHGASEHAHAAIRSLFIITNGLCGEAGEATEHFKKLVRDGTIDKHKAGNELGDVLAYLTWLAASLGFKLEDLAQLNYEKLIARGPAGRRMHFK